MNIVSLVLPIMIVTAASRRSKNDVSRHIEMKLKPLKTFLSSFLSPFLSFTIVNNHYNVEIRHDTMRILEAYNLR